MILACPSCSTECRTTQHAVAHLIQAHARTAEEALCEVLGPLDRTLDTLDAKKAAKAAAKTQGAVRAVPGPSGSPPSKPAAPSPPVLLPTAVCSSCKGPVGAAPTVEQARRIAGSHMLRYTGHSVVVRELPASRPAGGST